MKLFNKAKRLFSNLISPPKKKEYAGSVTNNKDIVIPIKKEKTLKKQLVSTKEAFERAKAISKRNRDEPTLELIKLNGQLYNHKILSAIGMLKKGRQIKMMVHAENQIAVIKKVIDRKSFNLSNKLIVNKVFNNITLTLSR